MKQNTHSSLIVLSALFFGASAYATNVLIPTETLPTETGDYTIYYSGSDASTVVGIDTSKTSYTPIKLTFASGDVDGNTYISPKNWEMNGNHTFNLTSNSANQVILQNNTGCMVKVKGSITVNRAENVESSDNAYAVIEMGNSRFYTEGTPIININANTKINSAYTTDAIYIGRKTKLNVASNAKLEINGKTKLEGANKSGDTFAHLSISTGSSATFNDEFKIQQYGDIVSNGDLIINQDTTWTVGSSSKITVGTTGSIDVKNTGASIGGSLVDISGNFTTNGDTTFKNSDVVVQTDANFNVSNGLLTVDGGSLTINGSLNRTVGSAKTKIINGAVVTATKLNQGSGQTITIGAISDNESSLVISGTNDYYQLQVHGYLIQESGNARFIRSATFYNGSNLIMNGDITLYNKNITDFKNSSSTSLIINDGANVSFSGNLYMQNARLMLKKENALGTDAKIFLNSNSTKALLDLDASQEFDTITADTKTLEIDIAQNVVLNASFVSENNGRFIVFNFTDNQIKLKNATDISDVNTIFQAYSSSDMSQKIDSLYITSDGWLAMATVPEPAEWAFILGALALGITIYRRRK